jgi:protein TonB
MFTGITYAQEGVNVKGNSIITKEIAPVWPGCETSKEASKDCFNKQLMAHIKQNFKYPKDSNGAIIRGKSIVSFDIDETGKVKDIKATGNQKEINQEAIRIVKLFPEMTPGIRGGKAVPISYKMPFNF